MLLTDREKMVLHWLANGVSAGEIRERLRIAPAITVEPGLKMTLTKGNGDVRAFL
jgi:DNA-binding NarL/FixJ family response regulator